MWGGEGGGGGGGGGSSGSVSLFAATSERRRVCACVRVWLCGCFGAGMLPRGLKKLIKDTAPCKLVGRHHTAHFQTHDGRRLRGLTKRLENNVFSKGLMPAIARSSALPAGGHWRGAGGGRRRGSAVDAQVSRLAGASAAARSSARMLQLARHVFATFSERGLEPVLGQRAVCAARLGIGTAADVICYNAATKELVVVELKCGHSSGRTAVAIWDRKPLKMRGVLSACDDSTLHRHLAQLACTRAMLLQEQETMARLADIGVAGVGGVLIYANDANVAVYELPKWWCEKAPLVLRALQ